MLLKSLQFSVHKETELEEVEPQSQEETWIDL